MHSHRQDVLKQWDHAVCTQRYRPVLMKDFNDGLLCRGVAVEAVRIEPGTAHRLLQACKGMHRICVLMQRSAHSPNLCIGCLDVPHLLTVFRLYVACA